MLADLEALVPPVVMCILFIALIKTILKAQNPQRRSENRQREAAAEAADPRIDTSQDEVWLAAVRARPAKQARPKAPSLPDQPTDQTT